MGWVQGCCPCALTLPRTATRPLLHAPVGCLLQVVHAALVRGPLGLGHPVRAALVVAVPAMHGVLARVAAVHEADGGAEVLDRAADSHLRQTGDRASNLCGVSGGVGCPYSPSNPSPAALWAPIASPAPSDSQRGRRAPRGRTGRAACAGRC